MEGNVLSSKGGVQVSFRVPNSISKAQQLIGSGGQWYLARHVGLRPRRVTKENKEGPMEGRGSVHVYGW